MKDFKRNPAHFLNERYKVDAIWINIESYTHFMNNHLDYLTRQVSEGVLTNGQVIQEMTDLIKAAGELISHDLTNTNQCFSFIRQNFPHATFGSYEDTISIANLSTEQMTTCLQQEGLNFDYGRVDENGNVPLEDMHYEEL